MSIELAVKEWKLAFSDGQATEVETGNGRPLGPNKRGEVRRHLQRLQLVNNQIKKVVRKQKQEVQERSGDEDDHD